MTTGIRRCARTLAAVLAASALVVGASAVHAAPAGSGAALPKGFTTWAEVFRVQEKLNAAADHIVAARGSGYAGIVAAPESRGLQVYWKGAVPASVRQIAGRSGVPVRFLPARYTEREMVAEAQRLATNPEVRSVGPRVDGSGLTVNLTGAGQQALRSRTGTFAATPMPLHVESEPAPEFLDSRQDDDSPYWGGSNYTVGGFMCSSGFAIEWNGAARMLSAGHCGNNLDVVASGDGSLVGDITNDVDSRDTLMIDSRIEGETFEGFTFTGPFTSATGVDVVDVESDYVGNFVCTSGARTGEHCSIVVQAVNQTVLGRYPMVTAELHEGCAVAKGDSGGPVYSYGTGGALARGIISAGVNGTAVCPNAPVSESSRKVAYAPLWRPAGDASIGALQFYRDAWIL